MGMTTRGKKFLVLRHDKCTEEIERKTTGALVEIQGQSPLLLLIIGSTPIIYLNHRSWMDLSRMGIPGNLLKNLSREDVRRMEKCFSSRFGLNNTG